MPHYRMGQMPTPDDWAYLLGLIPPLWRPRRKLDVSKLEYGTKIVLLGRRQEIHMEVAIPSLNMVSVERHHYGWDQWRRITDALTSPRSTSTAVLPTIIACKKVASGDLSGVRFWLIFTKRPKQ